MTQQLYKPISIEVGCLQEVSNRHESGYLEQVFTNVKEKWLEHYQMYEMVATTPEAGVARFTCQKCGGELKNLVFKSRQKVRREKLLRFTICLTIAAIALWGFTNAGKEVAILAIIIGFLYLIEALRAVPVLKIGKELELVKIKTTSGYYVTTTKHKYRKDGKWVFSSSFRASKRK